ncbi:MAG TPA: ABC transporter permease [Firmicutes bacterium]|nr:ABC transporter permease [Candidatus Fermentithermobacillaceae bacterium]
MRTYIIRRLLQMIPLLIGISIVNFTIMHLAPGDPVDLLVERNATAEERARIRELYGLNDPIYVQYFRWLSHVLRGDFGKSFVDGQSVSKTILERLPYTLYLNFLIMVVIYAVAVPIGIISALKQYSKFDHIMTTLAFLGQAVPSFWIGLILIYFFGLKLDWLPISGVGTIGLNVRTAGFWATFVDRAAHVVMPVIVVAFGSLTGVARYMRSSMLEVIRQDYVRTARAKGLPEKVVIVKHALRNALLPIVTLLGNELPLLFGGLVVIESIFSWPGIGLLSIRAIFQRDYQIVMAINMMGATLMVLGNFLADLLYVVVDPRIKYS